MQYGDSNNQKMRRRSDKGRIPTDNGRLPTSLKRSRFVLNKLHSNDVSKKMLVFGLYVNL